MSWREWLSLLRSAQQKFDDGSRIKPVNRDFYQYSERDGRIVEVDCGLTGLKTPTRIVYRDSVKRWKPPDDEEPISKTKQQEIVRKFVGYFERRCVSVEVRDN